jgi:endo-1,4-beta-D-glucanase Y
VRRFAAILFWLCSAVLAATAASTPAGAEATVQPSEWNLYKARFLDPAGRIVDNANGNISHSEGQGYGLLLSYLADDRGDFDRIWSFTRTEMLVRNDGLAAWKWDPLAKPHVSDTNNATDGDLLMAYSSPVPHGTAPT